MLWDLSKKTLAVYDFSQSLCSCSQSLYSCSQSPYSCRQIVLVCVNEMPMWTKQKIFIWFACMETHHWEVILPWGHVHSYDFLLPSLSCIVAMFCLYSSPPPSCSYLPSGPLLVVLLCHWLWNITHSWQYICTDEWPLNAVWIKARTIASLPLPHARNARYLSMHLLL